MLSTSLFLLPLLAGSSIAGLDAPSKAVIEKIEEEMSREVVEEFSGKEHQDELALLKKQYAAAHSGNESTYITIPTELDINANHTELFEGDIVLSPEQWKIARDFDPENPMRRRQGLAEMTWMWPPSGAPVIPYTFENGFPAQYQQVVRDAIAFWEQRTCIKFRVATPSDTSAIVFNHNANGCSSAIGRRNQRQQLNLEAPGCMTVTIVAHELSHALGTLHVQSRVDRDTYVTIDTANIVPGQEHNFRMEPNGYSTYGLPYEFGSMQHYFPYAFAVDKTRPTIYAKPAYQKFQGSMDGPRATFWDTVLINKMYKCTDKCPRQMACQNNGVIDGANCNKCFCPRGWTGINCERRPADAQIVNVAATVQNLRVEMMTPYTSFEEKLVVLQAPAGKKIEATVKTFGPWKFSMCRSIGIEVIPTTDTRTSGYRFCAPPSPFVPVVSDGNVMLLWLYRDVNYTVFTDVDELDHFSRSAMSQVPLPFCVTVLVISIFGLAGNIRFFGGNFREKSVHKQLLVLMTALHIVLCLVQMSDIARELLGFSLTRSTCLRFVGAYYASFSFAQSILYSLMGLEVLVLISDANLYRKLRVWWFHALIYSTFIFSGWCIYQSWISDEDRPVLLCIPPTAMSKEVNTIRSTWVMLNSCFILIVYVVILGILLVKRNGQRSSYTDKIIKSTGILTIVFTCSWFVTGFLVSFSSPISRILNIPISYVIMAATLPAIVTYSQTHYVYFFVSAENRKAFRRLGETNRLVSACIKIV